MHVNLTPVPVFQWIHREFSGADPWAANVAVQWSVVVYKLAPQTYVGATPVAKQTVPSSSNDIPKALSVGIFSREHNRYRILPLALQDLWRQGKVRDEQLPALLFEIETLLRTSDYPPGRPPVTMKSTGILFGLIGAASLWAHYTQHLHHPMQIVALWSGMFFLSLGIGCLVTGFIWQQRRAQLTDRILSMVQGTEVNRPRRTNLSSAGFLIAVLLLRGGWANAQTGNAPSISFLGQSYRLGSYNQRDHPMWEFVAPAENVNTWTKLVTLIDRSEVHSLIAKTMADKAGTTFNYMVASFEEPSHQRGELDFVKIAMGPKNGYTLIHGVRLMGLGDHGTKSFLEKHSSQIGQALEQFVPPNTGTLPRKVF